MINSIINGIFNFVIGLVNLMLAPIDSVINNFIPQLGTAIDSIGSFFDTIGNFIPYIVSWLNLPLWFLKLVVDYYVFRFTVFLIVHTVKTALAWYNVLKP